VINQKYVWKIVNSRKGKAKLIVIVTHSHEEAIHSADHIVIISDGQIQQEGTPMEIKKKMGDFQTLNILVDVSNSEEIKTRISGIIPDATIAAENAGSIVYLIPKIDEQHSRLELFAYLRKEPNIKDWKFSSSAENFLIK